MNVGEKVYVEYSCRDIGYGVESGEDDFWFLGRETLAGKMILEPINGGPLIYLFDDELVSVTPVSSDAL